LKSGIVQGGSPGYGGRNSLAFCQLVTPVAREVPRHHQQPADGVRGLPRLRLDPENLELDRQDRALGEEGVDAGRVSLEVRRRLAIELRGDALGESREAERAHELVGLEGALAEEFAQPSLRHAPLEFHLPEAILRVHVAHREPAIALALRIDVRHAFAVAQDLDARHDPLRAHFAFDARQRFLEVEPRARRGEREDDDDAGEYLADDLHVTNGIASIRLR